MLSFAFYISNSLHFVVGICSSSFFCTRASEVNNSECSVVCFYYMMMYNCAPSSPPPPSPPPPYFWRALLFSLLLLLLRLLSEKLPSSRSGSSAWNQRAATRTGKKRRDFQRSVHRARRRPQLFVFRLLFAPVRVSYCFHRFCFRHPIFTDDGFRFYRFLHRFSVRAEHVLAFSRRRARPGFLLPPVSLHGLVREQRPSLLS